MENNSGQQDRSTTPASSSCEEFDVEHEGLDGLNSSSFDHDEGRRTTSARFNVPDENTSDEQLAENYEQILQFSAPQSDVSSITCPSRPPAAVRRSEALRNVFSQLFPTRFRPSPEPGTRQQQLSDSEDRLRREISGQQLQQNHKMVKSVQHRNDKSPRPLPGILTKCSCSSCSAENQICISRDFGSTQATSSDPSVTWRAAEKCELIRSIDRVKFSRMQVTVPYDPESGEAFDSCVERLDLSCMKKKVGRLRTWSLDAVDEDLEAFSKEDEEEGDDSEKEEYSGPDRDEEAEKQ